MGKTNKAAGKSAPDAKGRAGATKLILAATALVVSATVYILVADPFGREPKRPGKPTPAEEARKVLRSMEDLLATADATDPRGGPANLARRRVAYEQAAQLGRSFIQYSDQRDVLVRPALAKALLRLGKVDDAEKTVNALLKLAPRSAEALRLKGEILQSRGDPGALEHFRRAAESERATPEILARYGGALIPAGQYDRAETLLLRALRGGCREDNVLLGLAVLAMRDNRHAEAESYLAELAGRGRPGVRTLVMLAECQKENARPADAEKTLRKVLADQDLPELHIPLGDVLDIQGKQVEAAAEYARAAEASGPMQALACFKAARAYHAVERYALAMKYIDRAAALTDGEQLRYWKKKIEDARFGEVAASDTGSLLPPPGPGAPAGDANAASPTTRPGGSLLDFKWK